MKIFSLYLALFMAQSALAFQPLKIKINEGDKLQIRGQRGSISYLVIPGAKDIAVEVDEPEVKEAGADEWQFGFRRENDQIILQIDSPISKSTWAGLLAKGKSAIPTYDLKITGPNLPVNINWYDGNIELKNYSETIRLTQVSGLVSISGGEGDVFINQLEGQIRVTGRKGQVRVDTYGAMVELSALEGDVQLENFTGSSLIKNIKGNIQMTSYRGDSKFNQIVGKMDFTNGVSPLTIDNFEGELRGKSLQGPVSASITGEANVRVESQDGAVNIKLAGSGAYVNAGTSEGSLQVPSFLRLTRLPSQQIRTGRLRGPQGGNVFVRTTTGDIRIR